jgi:hypothetical protein
MFAMLFLRRALYAMAAVWAGCGVALVAAPRVVLVDVFHQVPYPDYAYVRIAGVVSFATALLMVITAQKLEEMWVFTWAFVFAGAGTFAVAGANAAWGHPSRSGLLLWWSFAAISLAFTLALLIGLAKTGTERPPV